MRPLLKVFRDLWLTRGRVAFMVLALAAGLTSTGSVLAMRTVVQREMNREYMDTTPASATLDVGERRMSDEDLATVRSYPEVAVAERRATREGRWRHPGGSWGRALVFASESFPDQRLATVHSESGASVPPTGGVLVERSAMGVLGAEVGDTVEVALPSGQPVPLTIAGVVHDPALPPAIQEQAGYFYITADTFAMLGGTALDEVRILVARDPLDPVAVESQVTAVANRMVSDGIELHEVRIPPPAQHPHQAPSEAILLLFWIFSALTVGLAGVLSASLLSITMARQVREVAVMKTIGATGGDVRRMYAAMIGTIAVGALLLSAGPTAILARGGIDSVTALLNFDVESYAVPWWVIGLQIALGLALPVLTAAPAIVGASRRTVRDAMDDHGVRGTESSLSTGLVRGLAGGNRIVATAVRNAVRVPRRLALTVGLLAVGGSLFISASSVSRSWEALTSQVLEDRHYAVEVQLAEAVTPELVAALAPWEVETWAMAPATVSSASGLPISRTYPDGGHGSLSVVGVPSEIELVDHRVVAGRWLARGETRAAVLNQGAVAHVDAETVLGQTIELVVEGRRSTWTVVGVVQEVASPAQIYVPIDAFQDRIGAAPNLLRIGGGATTAAVGRELGDARIARILPLQLLYNAMGEHVGVLVQSLLGLAVLMAVVGALALGSTMSTSVVERTRELGILRAVGARPSQVRWMVLIEGWLVSTASLPLAVLLAIPLSALIGRVVGDLAFQIPLPLALSWTSIAAWCVGVLGVATLASLLPARTANRRTIRESVGHI